MSRRASDFADEEFVTADYNDVDIVIVGAGLSGLTCAYNILRRKTGLEVLIIEANRDVGGRILKDYSNSYYANSLQEHVTKLVEMFNINTYPEQNIGVKERILFTRYGHFKNLPKFYGAEVHNFLHMVEKSALDPRFSNYAMHEDSELLAKTSVEQLLRRVVYFPYSRSLCRAFVCSSCATRGLKNISSLWLLVMLNGSSGFFNRLRFTIGDENRYFIQGGMTNIVQELLKKVIHHGGKIRYLDPVNKIRFNDDRAYVQTERKCFKCEFVVLAVPPPMKDIVIESSSECFLNRQNLYVSGENLFFKIIYETPPWLNNGAKDIVTTWDINSNLNTAYNATFGDSRTFALSGFLDQPDSVQTHKKGLFDTLNECFNTTEAQTYVQYKLWNPVLLSDQTLISSPWSVMKPTSIINHVNYAGVPKGRVFLASSENAVNWPGTVDGAIEIGEITAYSILSRIRPQVLTSHEINIMYAKIKNEKTTNFFQDRCYSVLRSSV
ncbi:amine oxidase [flavin-containing] A-like [Nomia melanderi]|uniref:amine oxidase [flavin-containing] A-like n=1 Tax=Nomia melanderi TaxID=2448451 RepID=UPI003FCD6EBF